MKIQTIIISEGNNTVELFKRYVQTSDKFSFLVGLSDYTKVFSAIKELEKALILVDISQYPEQGLNFVSKIVDEFANCRVVTLTDKPDTDTVIRSIRSGASEVVGIPVIKEEFLSALDKIYADLNGLQPKKSKCKIISVYSNKGGVGKTSIAVNLALELAKITKENIALVDLNFQLGDVITFLDLKPTFNISNMFQNLDKLNSEFLLSTMEKYKETSLYVLADPPYLKQKDNVKLEEISKLFEKLKDTFSYVVVDTSGGFDKKAFKVLEMSDLVFLVTIVNLPALRNCQRCLELFESMSFDKEKVQILVNRYMENDEIDADSVEKVLGKNIYWKVPNNYFTMMSAINNGVAVSEINPDSNVALNYKNLALKISDNIYRGNLNASI